MGVGSGVVVGVDGMGVGDAKTVGELGIPPEQELRASIKTIKQMRFSFDILMIISDVLVQMR